MSPPRFNSQFSFGQDGKLAGRCGLSGLDGLIAGIDGFRAPAAHSSSRKRAQRVRRGGPRRLVTSAAAASPGLT
jgi:hypothetical protein